jgi:hypothetical protein
VIVALCVGKSCRHRPEHRTLRDGLTASATVIEMGCSGICTGQVVVVEPREDRPLVLARVRSKKQRRDLRRVTRGAQPSERLLKRTVSGSKRAKVLRKAHRALAR